MSGAIMNKVWDLFKMPAEDKDDEDAVDYDEVLDKDEKEDEESGEERRFFGKRNNKVVNMPQTQQIKMVISQPTTFEQSEAICDLLKEKKSVIVNLEYVNKDVARRIIDVVSGAVNAIFLIAPFNYDIENEMVREEMRSKISVSWLRNGNNTIK